MKRFLVAALLTLWAAFPVLCQTPDSKTEGKAQDEAAIRKLMKDLEVAWNSHDGVPFSALFAEDADFTNWWLRRREEIKKMNANLAVGMFRKSALTLTDARVRSLRRTLPRSTASGRLSAQLTMTVREPYRPERTSRFLSLQRIKATGRLQSCTAFCSSLCLREPS
jgi:uncharacterized protein (TIGR02246 family)